VLSSVVEGFPASLVEAMFCARATVSTDVGAVVEIIGGTGLVVPPRNPRALADACLALLREPERRHRLGAAARARALELFTVEQNLAAFRGIYLELLSHAPVRHRPGDGVPFAHPAEAHVPGSWAHKAVAAGTGAPDA
ncbi:glycosyltransferase, partial [Streptomyces massasporeus]